MIKKKYVWISGGPLKRCPSNADISFSEELKDEIVESGFQIVLDPSGSAYGNGRKINLWKHVPF
jgi:hypothetical protein